MHSSDKKRKHSLGEPGGVGLFAKKPRTSSKVTDLEMRVVAGCFHSFIKGKGKDGEDTLYASGSNEYGQLGLGDVRKIAEWTEAPVPKDFTIEKVMAGYRHTFLKGKGKDGEDKLYASGKNHHGQLGVGDRRKRKKFTEVSVPQGFSVEKVVVGDNHSFLKGKGKGGEDKLYASGWNKYGQLGLGDNNDRNEWTEVPVPQGFSVEKVVVGENHSFLKGKGVGGENMLYASGLNHFGQLGLGDKNNRRKWTEVPFPKGFKLEQVAVRNYHSFLIGKGVNGEDKLYAMGYNWEGQLGLGDRRNRKKWTEVPITDLLKKLQKDVSDSKQEGGVSEASGSSSSSMGLNPRDCIF